jgi:hypothetical protein
MIYGFSPIVPHRSIVCELYMIEPNTLSALTPSTIYFPSLMYNKVVFFSHQSILVLPSEIYCTQESYGPALLSDNFRSKVCYR